MTVLRDFTDAKGVAMRAGGGGVLREISYDQLKDELHLGIHREARTVALVFALKVKEGPRNGHMQEFFELGDYVPVPRIEAVRRDPSARTMIIPTRKVGFAEDSGPD